MSKNIITRLRNMRLVPGAREQGTGTERRSEKRGTDVTQQSRYSGQSWDSPAALLLQQFPKSHQPASHSPVICTHRGPQGADR